MRKWLLTLGVFCLATLAMACEEEPKIKPLPPAAFELEIPSDGGMYSFQGTSDRMFTVLNFDRKTFELATTTPLSGQELILAFERDLATGNIVVYGFVEDSNDKVGSFVERYIRGEIEPIFLKEERLDPIPAKTFVEKSLESEGVIDENVFEEGDEEEGVDKL